MKFIGICIICLLLVGCAQVIPQVVTWDNQNMASTIAGAKLLMTHWPANDKALRIIIGDAIIASKFPAEFKISLDRMRELSKQYLTEADRNKMKEVDASEIVTLFWWKLFTPGVKELFNQYAPKIWEQVMKYAPMFIAL